MASSRLVVCNSVSFLQWNDGKNKANPAAKAGGGYGDSVSGSKAGAFSPGSRARTKVQARKAPILAQHLRELFTFYWAIPLLGIY